MIAGHLARLKSGVYATYGLDQIAKWVTENTYLGGRRYSFKGHEFQLPVLQATEQEVNCQKCSQVGLTEGTLRWALGVLSTFPHFSVIYTMPYSNDAKVLAQTRVDTIITDSPYLREHVNPGLNNSEVKQINRSLIYFRGTQGNTQAISIPADCIVSDEIDRSSPAILEQYTSRLSHSAWKLRRNFSTPTVDGYGIALKMSTSRRYRSMCKCLHCNFSFVPNYHDHVKVPGFDGDIRTITKAMLSRVRWKEARLLCPRCGGTPSLLPAYRQLVCENSEEQHDAIGFYVSPFDAPMLRTAADLIKDQTSYRKVSEFDNQALGITSIDKEAQLTREDLLLAKVESSLVDSGVYAMGADLGLTCHIAIGRIEYDGKFIVVHRERVPLSQFESRAVELAGKYRCIIKVFDSQPYVDTITRMQAKDQNLWASVFVNTKKVEVFKVQEQEKEPEEGKLNVRQVSVNRNKAFDELVGHIKKVGFHYAAQSDEDEEFIEHCLDMKRVQTQDKEGETVYEWVKSEQGDDHYYFALLYLYIAARLRGVYNGGLSTAILLMKATVRPKDDGAYVPLA